MGLANSSVVIEQTPVITAGIYSTGDALGGKLTFEYSARRPGGTGTIMSLTIVDEADQGVALDLILFNKDFSATADNAAIAISDADAINIIGIINVASGDYTDTGANKTAELTNVKLKFKCKEDWADDNTGKKLYGQLVTRGTPTYAATNDITVKLKIDQD